MKSWRPMLSPAEDAPIYRRLVAAMVRDLSTGALAPGARLPPQRVLAHALGISVGAVTRAYDEAARRGLVAAHVGRGTFVADRHAPGGGAPGPIDLSINVAPIAPLEAMAAAIDALRRTADWSERLNYLPTGGLEADRRAAAAWLARSAGLEGVDWRTLLCCAGAQNAMAVAFGALCRTGEVVLCEAATFSGVKALAAQLGYRLHGVGMDGEGVRPEALERAAAETGARVFYTLPTLQNPTARTAGRHRRAEIVAVARRQDLWLIEDDVYAAYARDHAPIPIAVLAPERTLYLSSLSKLLAPGLRAGFLVAPAGEVHERCLRATRAFTHSQPGVGNAVATYWLQSGRADALMREVREEVRLRTEMALAALAGAAEPPGGEASLHLWLPMAPATAERVAARALTAGLRLTQPAAYTVSDPETSGGLRVCLGAAPDRASLARALQILGRALTGEADDSALASL